MDVPVHIAVDRVELRPARVVQDDRTAGLRRLAALRGEALAEIDEALGRQHRTGRPHRRARGRSAAGLARSEEHTSELQSLMRISYAVFCLKKKQNSTHIKPDQQIQTQTSYKSI